MQLHTKLGCVIGGSCWFIMYNVTENALYTTFHKLGCLGSNTCVVVPRTMVTALMFVKFVKGKLPLESDKIRDADKE